MAKRNLEGASRISGVPLSIRWEPTLLAPSTPPEGWDLDFYMHKFYGKEIAERFLSPNHMLKVCGRQVGIEFNDRRRLILTGDSHRLVEYCRETMPERENELMELMLWRYNTEALDMSKPLHLLECAVACGLPRNGVAIMLASGKYKEEVDAKIAANRAMIKERKKGIPYTTIATAQGQILFSGMLPVQAKAEGLADMLLEWSDNAEQLAASATTAAAPPVEAS